MKKPEPVLGLQVSSSDTVSGTQPLVTRTLTMFNESLRGEHSHDKHILHSTKGPLQELTHSSQTCKCSWES